MFFYAAKIGWFFLQPSSALLILLFIGIALLWTRFAHAGRRVVLAAGLLYLIAGLSPLGHAVMLPLEERFPPADLSQGRPPDGIVILGGGQDMLVSAARGQAALTEAGERFTEAVVLARRFPAARLVFSGGSGGILYDRASEAEGAAALLTALGIAPERLTLEQRSRDTYENALYTRKLVAPAPGERWLLITSANHMPRAMGAFRSAGFPVEPWPVDYRTRGPADLTRFFSKPSSGLRRLDLATRQWAGLFVYWLTGRSSELFPAP
ncbi:MAG: YdcF family protein [Alphaproteobacteria bacterium]|nr:MAG: YdcF family protein [Alphaproteobacteria bacterium]